MVRFLFWNINRKLLQSRLANLVRHLDVDIIVLAECIIDHDEFLAALNADSTAPYRDTFSLLETIAVFTRLPESAIETLEDSPNTRVTIRRVQPPSGQEVLLAIAHFPSKLHWSGESQIQPCVQLAARLCRFEQRLGHTRTVILGDLNMNPFEAGVVASYGLHATMARSVASGQSRIIQGEEFPFFYNPMWGHFGDISDGPPGTYYDRRAEAVSYFWNMFDQVMIRPSLLQAFRNESLRILESDGLEPLCTLGGLPDDNKASDHFPIVFDLDL